MCGSKTIINMFTRNFFMATTNLKDTYYSVSIGRLFQKFLKFKWKDKLYCFTGFPNGLESWPRQLTKLHKVQIVTLHFLKLILIGYVDYFLLSETLFQYVNKT